MNAGQAWKILGIARTSDVGAVRRAYADKLKASNPDSDPAAYADLRDARDMALRIARQMAEKAAVPDAREPEPTEGSAAASWALAAPLIEPAITAPGLSTSAPTTGGTMRPITIGFAEDFDPEDKALGGDPWAIPALAAEQAAQPDQLVMRLAPADQRLWNLLYANGHEDTAQFDDTELIAANAALHGVLADASGGSLTQHEVIEDWLANTLAGSWPRCAPLLEEAATFFGWEREAGKLGERHSVAFLNARAKGLRFHRKVLDPKHRLHKAWVELQRDGRANTFDRLRTSKHDVQTLLDGIRKNFPEMEDHLNPQRVGSWQDGGGSFGKGKVQGPGRWIWAIGAFVVLRLIIAIGDMAPETPKTLLDPAADAPIIQRAIDMAFGGGSIDAVRGKNAELASVITSNVRMNKSTGVADDVSTSRIVDLIRDRAYEAARADGGANLDAAMRVRLGLLRAANRKGTDACIQFLRLRRLDLGVEVPKTVLAADQRLSSAMLTADKLAYPAPQKQESAMVPGALVGQVIKSSGLSDARVRKTMEGDGSEADTCAVRVALLDATLKWKGKERTAILKTL